jgi:hypothetical protein
VNDGIVHRYRRRYRKPILPVAAPGKAWMRRDKSAAATKREAPVVTGLWPVLPSNRRMFHAKARKTRRKGMKDVD